MKHLVAELYPPAMRDYLCGTPGIVKRYGVSLRPSLGELQPSEIGASDFSLSGSKAKK